VRTKLLVLGLAISFISAAQSWASSPLDSCGAKDVSFQINKQKGDAAKPFSSPDKAKLVFVQRNERCIGCSVTRVGIDGAWIGANKGDSYFAVTIEPGEHHVCANWGAPLARTEAKVELTDLQAEAGKVYYFETEVASYGQNRAPQMNLKRLSSDEGAFLVSRSEMAVATPKQR